MTRITTTGRDHWNPPARSGNSREYIHGPLQPMDEEHEFNLALIRFLRPSLRRSMFWLLMVAIVGAFSLVLMPAAKGAVQQSYFHQGAGDAE